MKDLTVEEFCKKFNACPSGIEESYKRFPEGKKAMMSKHWDAAIDNPINFIWIATRSGVFPEKTIMMASCTIVRGTPIGGGKTVWDLLTDDRSRKCVEIIEAFCNGNATRKELDTAAAYARAAARAAAYATAITAAAAAAATATAAAAADAADAAAAAAAAAAYAAAITAAAAYAAARHYQIGVYRALGNPFKDYL